MNEMEVLARASLTIEDLARNPGFEGEVLIEAEAYLVPDEDALKSHKEALAEIHEGQRALKKHGWSRAPEFLIERMWTPNHNVERGAWFKDDHEKKVTHWITCQVTSRFGLRAIFTNKQDRGVRLIQRDELNEIVSEHYGIEELED